MKTVADILTLILMSYLNGLHKVTKGQRRGFDLTHACTCTCFVFKSTTWICTKLYSR
jgi:hypothetical protein